MALTDVTARNARAKDKPYQLHDAGGLYLLMNRVPGFKFHPLKGDHKGDYAVSVSGNWRITFRFDGEDACNVDLEDYH